MRLGSGSGAISYGDSTVIDNSPNPNVDFGNLNVGFFGNGNNGLIVNGQVIPAGASLLDGGDLIVGTAVAPVTITEIAHTVFGGQQSLTLPALPLSGDLVVLMITMNGARPPGTAGLAVVNVITPTNPTGNPNAPYNWVCASTFISDPQQGSMTATCFAAPAFLVDTGLPGPVITFTGPCSGVVRAYAVSNVSLMSVGRGLSDVSEDGTENAGLSTAATDGGAPSGVGGPSLTLAQISVIAYDSQVATLSGLPGSFTNSAVVHANNMTEQSGSLVFTRGSAPAAYAGTISQAQNWVALSVQFTGLASQGERVAAGTSGYVLTSNGPGFAPSWQAGGGGGVTWPLTATTDMGFQPDSVANSVLILRNGVGGIDSLVVASNATGITMTATDALTIDASGTGTIAIGTGSSGPITLGTDTTVSGTATLAQANVTSTSATAFTVAGAGSNYGLQVDESTGSAATGIKIKAAAAAGGVAVSVISSGTNEALTIDAKGSGTIGIGTISSGAITLGRATTISGTATLAQANVTSTSATAFTVAGAGSNYGLQVDESTGSAATGIKIKAAAAAGGVAVSVISSGTNEALTIDAKGSGTITLAGTSTGAVVVGHGLTVSASGAGITGNSTVAGTLGVTSTSATAFTVTGSGSNYGLQVDESTGSAATGIKIKAAAAAGGVAVSVISSGTNENLTIDAKGSGTITLAGTSTGLVQIGHILNILADLQVNGSSGTLGNVLTSAGAGAVPTWSPASGVTFPLTSTGDEGFQPNSVANSTLNLHNTALATTGLNIQGKVAGLGVAITVLSSAGNEALTIDAKGSGAILIAGTSSGTVTIARDTSVAAATATAFTVLASGTNYGLQVDESTASAVTGLKITAGAAGGGVTLSVISSAASEGMTINAKGGNSITLGNSGTNNILLQVPTGITGTLTVTSASATAFTVGAGGSNYGLQVDESTGSAVTGLLIKAGAAGGGLALSVINGNAAENLTLDAKGAGTIGIGTVSTGAVTVGPATSITGGLNSTRIAKRVLPLSANSATPAINTDNYDVVHITAQTAAITSFTTNLTGTPVDGDTLRISITGTAAVGLTWGASFEASTVALPTTTVTTARLDVGFFWNTETSKWRCVATA